MGLSVQAQEEEKEEVNQPPIPIGELEESIEKSIHEIWEKPSMWGALGLSIQSWITKHIDLEHSIPSASTIDSCILRLWYEAKGRQTDMEVPTSWKGAQLAGIVSELTYIAVLKNAGIELESGETFELADGLLGTPDALADEFTVEIKQRTGYVYKKYVQSYGYVSGVEPNVYSQMQTCMAAADRDWGLLLVVPSDFAQLQTTMRQNKRWGPEYNLPPFHLEWVERNDNHIKYIVERFNKIKVAIGESEPPDREYSGIPVDKKGKKMWPCGYCPYNQLCIEEYGYGNR